MRPAALLALLLLAAAPATGQTEPPPEPAPAGEDEVTTYRLDNGMQVVVIEDHRAPVVVHMVWYRAGSADEPVGQSGVAHFLEHLLFKGTATVPDGGFSAIVAANGGSDNAFTSWDYTGYFQRIAADRLPLMMEMEADRMENLVLDEAVVATERDVILEERNMRVENSAQALAREQIMAAQYLNHRYGVPVIGWRHEMEALTLEDALSFYELYYSPNDAVLVVAGDVEPEAVLALAERYYGPIPAEPDLPERLRSEEPPQRAARHLDFVDPRVSQAYVVRSWLAPERDSGAQEEAAALTYLARILGGSSFTSVLSTKLVFEAGTALFTGAGYDGGSLDDTTFSVTVAPAPGVSLATAEAELDRALAEFLEEGVDPAQFERIRTQIAAAQIYARDDTQGLAQRYGAALTQGLTVEDVEAWPAVLDAVTPEQVMAAARAVFDPDTSVTAYIASSREEIDAPAAAPPPPDPEAEPLPAADALTEEVQQ